jgi:hypothetical protein
LQRGFLKIKQRKKIKAEMLPSFLLSAWTSFRDFFLSKMDMVNATAVALAGRSRGLPRMHHHGGIVQLSLPWES